ncbi:replicative DNA helicase, partial [Candidatus Nomurabacteria bacterium]|nr:replicative DNA helicase [Candidatus Nomurabacteria bacterium]
MAKEFSGKELKVPPQSIENEMAMLGSVMIRPEAIYDILDLIKPEFFYSDKHKIIWQTMLEMTSKSEPIDILSLSSRLKEKGMLDRVGGNSFLTELMHVVPSSANIEHYADVVKKKHTMRKLIEASEQILSLGYNEGGDLEEILDQANKKMFEVTNASGTHKFTAIKDALGEAWDRLDKLHRAKDELRGVPSGFKDLDNKLAGFQKSDLIILAARPSMGKTSLALDIARNAAIRHNIPVGVFSLEMSTQQLVDRMLAAESRVDAWKLRTGILHLENEFLKIRDSLDPLSKAPIYVDDQPGNNILKMRAVCRRLKTEKGL